MSDKLPDEVETFFTICDFCSGSIENACKTCNALRLSIAKAIRDAEERMRERCATIAHLPVVGPGRTVEARCAAADIEAGIRSLPLENA